ncbi:MAG: RrF2 family transcriptional regulator [Deltaproteobacteria bacterium]|nr:RrF2 family transcriptional regulator [Deltaproteobacteria bacterium]
MKLSIRGRYGMRLMLELALNYGQGPLSMSTISRRQDIPVKYLEQLIIPLKKQGLIESVRGPKGGHMLSRHPSEINVWQVVNLLETRVLLLDCLSEPEVCDHVKECLIRPVWGEAYEAVKRIFSETTLEDILRNHQH